MNIFNYRKTQAFDTLYSYIIKQVINVFWLSLLVYSCNYNSLRS